MVHPRVCGEHAGGAGAGERAVGSSPRVRGTRIAPTRQEVAERFIPACAGNTWAGSTKMIHPTVHPRVCGEHEPWQRLRAIYPRFIPACAGNTGEPARRRRDTAVHPRVCGEHSSPAGQLTQAAGSSPRVRGTRGQAEQDGDGRRFIPACAGNTTSHRPECVMAPVHPRVCGEHAPLRAVRRAQRRFIPACAGNTLNIKCLILFNFSGSSPSYRLKLLVKERRHTQSRWPLRGQEAYNFHAVHIGRNAPVCAAGVEIVADVTRRCPGDDRIAIFDQRLNLLPDHLPGPPRVVAHIDAGSNLHQPHRKPATQSGGRVVNRDDQHRRSALRVWRLVAPHPARVAVEVRPLQASPRCWV